MRTTGVQVSLLALGLVLAGCASAVRQAGPASRMPVPSTPVPKYAVGVTLESFDPALAAALLEVHTAPRPESHRRVAAEYARLGVLDAACRHYRAATSLDPYDAPAYDGLARLWRDAGLPHLALGEASRAVYYAPLSAQARNTLGSVFQALGQNDEARKAYEEVLLIDPAAAYALNNLGYLSLMEGDTATAIRYGAEALTADGALLAARHNLALAYGAAGRMDLARQTLREAGSVAFAQYTEGIVDLALGHSADALAAFEEACRSDAGYRDACGRASALKARMARADGGTQ